MVTPQTTGEPMKLARDTITTLLRQEGGDLTGRQIGVLLTCYIEGEPQTVRGLAARLGAPKPAITRAVDRLEELDLVRRKPDPRDRRSVLLQRTSRGAALIRELRSSAKEPRGAAARARAEA